MIHTVATLVLVLAAPADEVVARVGTETITQSQLREREAATRARGGATNYGALLEDLINDALMAQDGYRAGLERDPEVVAKVAAERGRLAAERMMEKEIVGAVNVTDAQVAEAYHASGDTVRYNLIVLASEEEAAAALKRLRSGASFAAEAVRSLDPTAAAQKGDSGLKSRGQLEPALAKLLFAAPLNAYSGPHKLELGYGALQVVSRQIADEAGLVAKREDLRRYLAVQLKAQYRSHYLSQLRSAAKVTIDEAFLRSTGTRLTASQAEQDKVIATAAGRGITYGEVLAVIVASLGGKEGGHFSGASVKTEFAWTQVDRALREAAAIERGFGADPSIQAALRRFERDEVARVGANRQRQAAKAPSEAELEAWYGEHKADFVVPAERACAHLVVRERAQLETLRGRLEKGERFEELVRGNSLDEGTAKSGGVLGVLNDERLAALEKTEPKLARAMREARPNQVSAPIESKLGWHLVRCGPTTPSGPRPLAQVREAISGRIRQDRETQSVLRHLEKLRAAATVSRDTAALGRLTPPSR